MKNVNFIVPKLLKVGFIDNCDNSKFNLGYITYIKDDGSIYKETSWQNWRDKTIPILDINNDPVKGLKINDFIGGCKSGWNFRKSYIRISDPRGFEFEIDLGNFTFIMENCDIVKKEIIGEFCYAWDGQTLLLLPTNSDEYKESLRHTTSITKFSLRDFKVDHAYKMKTGYDCLYLGQLEWSTYYDKNGYDKDYFSGRNLGTDYEFKRVTKKYHTFVRYTDYYGDLDEENVEFIIIRNGKEVLYEISRPAELNLKANDLVLWFKDNTVQGSNSIKLEPIKGSLKINKKTQNSIRYTIENDTPDFLEICIWEESYSPYGNSNTKQWQRDEEWKFNKKTGDLFKKPLTNHAWRCYNTSIPGYDYYKNSDKIEKGFLLGTTDSGHQFMLKSHIDGIWNKFSINKKSENLEIVRN